MAQTGYTPILIYASGTTGNAPSAGNMINSANGCELAINYFDGKLFYKDASNAIQVLATKNSAAGIFSNITVTGGTINNTPIGATTPSTGNFTSLTVSSPITLANGGTGLSSFTAGDIVYYSSGTSFTKLGIGSSGQVLTSNGSVPQWSTPAVGVSSISFGTTGLTPSTSTTGAVTVAGTLNVANGGTGLTSLTANYIPYGNGTSQFQSVSTFTFNGTTLNVPAVTASGAVSAASFSGAGTGLTGTAASLTAGSVSSITSGQVTTALGYTPAQIVRGTAVATTSGSTVDYTGLPAGIKRITVSLSGVSLSSNDQLIIRLITGTNTVVATGYVAGAWNSGGQASSTTAFNITRNIASSDAVYGNVVLVNETGNAWVSNGVVSSPTGGSSGSASSSGGITLGAALTGIRITNNGAGTFNAGSVNIVYEIF